jgi:hypothetical protein
MLGSKLEPIDEGDETEPIEATVPPEFADSPRTPRSNPRYNLRPSPSASSSSSPASHLSDISQNLAEAFRIADEALFGPRQTRQQRQTPLSDDVLHHFPSERKRKK